MTKGRPKTFKYKYSDYDDTVRKLLDLELSNDDMIKLNKVQENFRNLNAPRGYEYILKDLFILVEKHNISTADISKIYGVGVRMVQIWLKEIGLNRSVKQGKNVNNSIDLSLKTKNINSYSYNSSNYSTDYTEDIMKLLKSIDLTENELLIIDELKKDNIHKKHCGIITDLYKFYKLDFTPAEIAIIFNKNTRTIQMVMKSLELNRDRYEAQSIAVGKRDYKSIRQTFKKTMMNRYYSTQIKGSDVEGYIRNTLNLELPSILSNCEIIVGINSLGIINSEIDIPIIIIKNTDIYKFAIEVDGFYTHIDESSINRNIEKEALSKEKGYEFITLNTKAYYNNESDLIYKDSLDKEIQNVITNITEKLAIRNGD